jgi:hypothetical protein
MINIDEYAFPFDEAKSLFAKGPFQPMISHNAIVSLEMHDCLFTTWPNSCHPPTWPKTNLGEKKGSHERREDFFHE